MGGQSPVAMVHTRLRLEERLLLEAFERRRIPVLALPDRALTFPIGGSTGDYATVINRSMSATRRRYIARLFEAGGIRVVNSAAVTETCDDKVATAICLAARGVPMPPSVVSIGDEAGIAAIERIGYPVVVKPVDGSWGRMLSRLNDRDAAEAVLAHRRHLGGPSDRIVYAQRYLEKPGSDLRAIVIGDEVVGAIRRHGEHWITNTANGARSERCEVGPELAKLCLAAAAAVGGGFLGVDLVEDAEGGVVVIEVNATAELRGFLDAVGDNVIDQLVDHVLALPGTR